MQRSIKNIEKKYHTIIIGSGIGGLFAALSIAQFGLKVLVIEKHFAVGGYCSSFKRKGFTFDAGAQFITCASKANTPIGGLLSKNKIPTKFIPIEENTVFFGNSKHKIIYNEKEFVRMLKSIAPDDTKGIDDLIRLNRRVYLAYPRMGLHSERIKGIANKSYQQLLDDLIQDKIVKALLSFEWGYAGLPPERLSSIIMCMLMHEMLYLGVNQIVGGAQELSSGIAKKIENLGSTICTNYEVEKILIDGNCARGVIVDGVEIESENVISNIDARTTYLNLIGKEYLPISLVTEMNSMRESVSAFVLYLGMSIKDEDAEKIKGWHFTNFDMNDTQNNIPIVISIPSLKDRKIAPEGMHVVIVHTSPEFYQKCENGRRKGNFEEVLIDMINSIGEQRGVTGKLSEKIVVIESADEQTFFRYTKNSKGAIYGWEKSPQQVIALNELCDNLTNFYNVGHWTSVGCGLSGSAASGIQVSKKILKKTNHMLIRSTY